MNDSNLKLELKSLPVDSRRLDRKPPLNASIGMVTLAVWVTHVLAAPNSNQLSVLEACYSSDLNICPSSTGSGSDLTSITPDQVFAMGSMATRITGGKNAVPYDYFGANLKGKVGGGAGDIDLSPLSFWSKLDSGFGSQTATFQNLAGYDYDNHTFMFGADYRISEAWMAGANFDYRHGSANFNGGRGETLSDSYIGRLYTSYFITDALHLDATAAYGGVDYETRRNVKVFGDTMLATAKPTAEEYSFSWGGGYDFTHHALTIAPYARGEYTALNIDSYKETGSDAAMGFDKQNIESLISTVGVQTSYAFSFPWGVLIPQLRGEWHHQFLDGSRSVTGNFLANGGSAKFRMVNDGPSRDYYTFGAEVSSVLPGGVSAFLAYETLQGYQNINSNRLMLGGRLEF